MGKPWKTQICSVVIIIRALTLISSNSCPPKIWVKMVSKIRLNSGKKKNSLIQKDFPKAFFTNLKNYEGEEAVTFADFPFAVRCNETSDDPSDAATARHIPFAKQNPKCESKSRMILENQMANCVWLKWPFSERFFRLTHWSTAHQNLRTWTAAGAYCLHLAAQVRISKRNDMIWQMFLCHCTNNLVWQIYK